MYTRKTLSLNSFAGDQRGTVAMMFGLMGSVLLFLAGMALDYTRAMDVRTRVADAADAAALAAGKALMSGNMDVAEIKALAQKYFVQNTANLKGLATIDPPAVNVDPQTGAVTIDVTSHVNMTLARIGGFKSLDFPVTTAVNFAQKDIEVGMALDITGSMDRVPAAGGDRKIVSLKSAFEKFAERLIPDSGSAHKVRIGVAPYSSSINLDTYASAVSRNRSNDGCVTERSGGRTSDEVGTFFVRADNAKDIDPTEGNVGNVSYACPAAKILPLSSDRDTLIGEVNKFRAEGWTAGHIGTQWAWNLISDKWSWGGDADADSYDKVKSGKLMKAVVLMTDGTFNTSYHGGKSSKQAIDLCNAMKAEGVIVFSVAFDATTDAQKTLRECATSSDYYVNAANGDQLEAAFLKFAGQLSDLRITK